MEFVKHIELVKIECKKPTIVKNYQLELDNSDFLALLVELEKIEQEELEYNDLQNLLLVRNGLLAL